MGQSAGNGFAIGLGLTNDCNLSCAHCYRDTGHVDRLSLADVRRVCESVPVKSINLGTGENGLHPEFQAILRYLRERGTAIALTSNGYSTAVLSDEELGSFADIEFSLDFATEPEQDAWRGAGNWRLVLEQAARCRRLRVPVTIIAVMMRTNYDKLSAIGAVAAAQGANFRINIYQPVKTDAFALDYEQFWTGFGSLLESFPLAVCNEPIVRAILGFEAASGGCGKGTIRVTPRGDVLPCVYWPKRSLKLSELEKWGAAIASSPAFRELDQIPRFCGSCRFVESCRGGCPSRRLLRGSLDLPDEFCPFATGKPLPSFSSQAESVRQFPKAGSACTTVFAAQVNGEAKA
ncbi:MAG: radical SAM protein [Candidatus Binataceae bacterium]|jgi:radical SAM protein with 4Fe4S-binding SPASM domain